MNEPELATQLPLEYVLAEDDAASVAEFTDTATEELDLLLGKSEDVTSLSKRIPEPSRTPVDYSRVEEDGFDASDNIIETIETPTIPVYIQPPQPRVEKRLEKIGATRKSTNPKRQAFLASDEYLNWPLGPDAPPLPEFTE